jgi:hypothetical protein
MEIRKMISMVNGREVRNIRTPRNYQSLEATVTALNTLINGGSEYSADDLDQARKSFNGAIRVRARIAELEAEGYERANTADEAPVLEVVED